VCARSNPIQSNPIRSIDPSIHCDMKCCFSFFVFRFSATDHREEERRRRRRKNADSLLLLFDLNLIQFMVYLFIPLPALTIKRKHDVNESIESIIIVLVLVLVPLRYTTHTNTHKHLFHVRVESLFLGYRNYNRDGT
jgi:uncharacterized membrane protein YhaH (DUF805 family)